MYIYIYNPFFCGSKLRQHVCFFWSDSHKLTINSLQVPIILQYFAQIHHKLLSLVNSIPWRQPGPQCPGASSAVGPGSCNHRGQRAEAGRAAVSVETHGAEAAAGWGL